MESVLTAEDCFTIVKKYLNQTDFSVKNVIVKPFFDEVNGFLGEHLLLLIEVEIEQQSKTLRFFAKKFPEDHAMQKDYLLSMQGWQREIFFFENFLKQIELTVPDYVIDFVPECLLGKPNNIVVFEDLTLKNYSMPRQDSLNLLNNEHICLVLKTLAKLHAGTLALEEYKSRKDGKPFRMFTGEEDLVKEPLIRKEKGFLGCDFYNAGTKGLKALISKVYKKEVKPLRSVLEKFDLLADQGLELMFPQKHFRNVLAHGDLWAKNVMFQYEGQSNVPLKVLLVDFQLQRYHVPAHDVLLFISLTTNQEVRNRYFHYFLKYYHQAISEELSKVNITADQIGMSYEEFLRSVSYIMPEIKIQGAIQRLQQCGNKQFYIDLLKNKEDYKQFIFVDKAPFVVKLFDTDSNFKSLLTESIEEIIEAVLYPQVFREDCYRILEEELGRNDYNLIDYWVSESSGSNIFELSLKIVNQGVEQILKFLIKSEPLDFVRVDKKL